MVDVWRKRIPEGWSSNGIASISHGAVFGYGDGSLGGMEVASQGETLVEVVEGCLCDEKNREFDPELYWNPVLFLQDKCDVFSGVEVDLQSKSIEFHQRFLVKVPVTLVVTSESV